MEVWGASAEDPVILNLPATVEMSTPNVYADQIEWFSRSLRQRDRVVLSVHPHNDRGTAVAAAEMAMMAGADRVEGTLFGNGERTGNVDVVTLALNLFSQGVDPGLDFRDINRWVRLAEDCTKLPVHPRHPYAGELVFTAFSGSHQDAIKKGLAAIETADDGASGQWEVPYLPVNPAHLGRSYDALIRVNSQSGKAGVSYLLERSVGARLPRRMQIEFQGIVQCAVERSGSEIRGPEIAALFEAEYLQDEGPLRVLEERTEITSGVHSECRTEAVVEWEGRPHTIAGRGNGPIDAFFDALVRGFSLGLRLSDFSEHALGEGADAQAIAYVEVSDGTGRAWYGAGRDPHIVRACLLAVVSGINRALAAGQTQADEAD
jgi:2-isopropylmalate synthase